MSCIVKSPNIEGGVSLIRAGKPYTPDAYATAFGRLPAAAIVGRAPSLAAQASIAPVPASAPPPRLVEPPVPPKPTGPTDRERSRTSMLKTAALQGGAMGAAANRMLAKEAAKSDPPAAPTTADFARDPAAASKAQMRHMVASGPGGQPASSGRASMLKEMAKQGIKPAA